MNDIFEEEKSNKPRKKIKKDLSKSEAFGKKITSIRKNSEVDDPDYLNDFLQHSRGAVFIKGNETKNNEPVIKKKKIIKKIIKKKKLSKSDNFKIISNNLFDINEEEIKQREKKEKEEKERKEKEEKENQKKKMLIKIINKKQKLENENNFYEGKTNNKISNYSNIDKNKEKYNNKTANKSINSSSENDNENNNDNSNKKEYTEDDSEIEEKTNNKKRISISSVSNDVVSQNENIDNNNSDIYEEKEEKREEEKFAYIKPKNKKNKNNLKEQLEKFEYEQRLIINSKFLVLIFKKIFNDIKNVLKIFIIYQKIKEYQKKSATKISSIFRAYSISNKIKLDFITSQILQTRKQNALKISSYYKRFLNRLETKKLLQKSKNNYIIHSSLISNKILYFKYKNQNGFEDNLYFEYSPLLKSFILFINKGEKANRIVIEGNFYNENYNKLTDPLYEINQKGQNVINFQKIFKKADSIKEKYDRISNRYVKLHRPAKRERIDDYEERKRKAADDNNLKRSNSINSKKLGGKVVEMSRSKSFMKLKPKKTKGILKPSKSYINLRCEEKKIHFGSARIKKYHNTKK